MATGQLFLTRYKAPPVTETPPIPATTTIQTQIVAPEEAQIIDQHQSMEVIQTLLAASIGSMAYLRGLFPDDCFVKMRYGLNRSATDYQAFTVENDGKTKADERDADRRGTKITRLCRGKSKEADVLLDWLENGVFRALEDSQLKALQLAIYLDESQPDIITESYTFSFSYLDGQNIPEINITDIHGHKVTVNDASKGAQQMTRRLLTITEGLPALPDQRWLTMRVHYHDSTPVDYNPPGFVRLPLGSASLMIPGDEKDVQRQHCGTMNAGFHCVSLKVSHAKKCLSLARGRRAMSRFCLVDNDIQAPQFDFKRSTTLKNASQDVFSSQRSLLLNSESDQHGSTKSTGPELQVSMSNGIHMSSTQPEVSNTPSAGTTSGTKEGIEKSILKRMLAPVRTESGWLPTQPIEPVKPKRNSRTGRFTSLSKRRSNPATSPSSKTLKRMRSSEPAKMVLKRSTAQNLLDNNGESAGSKKKTRRSNSHRVSCECGYFEEDGDMICCDICDKWQHAHCYGFTSSLDERLADLHSCYTCLLKDEQPLLQEMKELTLFRRALRFTWDTPKFPSTPEAFATEVGCDKPEALKLLKRLESEGFLRNKTKIATTPTKLSSLRNYLTFDVVKTEETEELERTYFDPWMKIAHHYCGSHDTSLLKVTPAITEHMDHDDEADTVPASVPLFEETQSQAPPSMLMALDHQPIAETPPQVVVSSVAQCETSIFVGYRT